jgi:hypothetical protein
MRPRLILLLAAGPLLAACGDDGGPSAEGTLVVSTTTGGNDPDPDGYLLTVDARDRFPLDVNDTAAIDLLAGLHTVQLMGVEEDCSVVPETPLEVDIPSHDTISVDFEAICSASAVSITTRTTGLDLGFGYRLEVDGADQGFLRANATALFRIEPGNRTIALAGLAPNCTIQGPGSLAVSVGDAEVAPIAFAVICTATRGVIGVTVDASGADAEGRYDAMVDGAGNFRVGPGGPAYQFAAAGDHIVSLAAPGNCSVETGPQSVTVLGGGLTRDTVEVTFSVRCRSGGYGTLRVTAVTTGNVPGQPYAVWLCNFADSYYCTYSTHTRLGDVSPNGTLVARATPGTHRLWLGGLPSYCSARNASPFNPTQPFTVTNGDTLSLTVRVYC